MDIKKIDRTQKTADAAKDRAVQDGYELYETNRRHYLLRKREKADTPAKGKAG